MKKHKKGKNWATHDVVIKDGQGRVKQVISEKVLNKTKSCQVKKLMNIHAKMVDRNIKKIKDRAELREIYHTVKKFKKSGYKGNSAYKFASFELKIHWRDVKEAFKKYRRGCKNLASNAVKHRDSRMNFPTIHEKAVIDILEKNNARFTFQPIVYSKILKLKISPDFFIWGWKGVLLKKQYFIEIDGDNKNLKNLYQIKREKSLNYPLIRFRNSEVENIEAVLNKLPREA